MRRVVVTGVGVVAPNGVGKDAFWSACVAGKSGVRDIESFDASGHPVRVAGEVRDFDVTPFVPPSQRKSIKIMSRAMRLAVGAAGLAVRAGAGVGQAPVDGGRAPPPVDGEQEHVGVGAAARAVRAHRDARPLQARPLGRELAPELVSEDLATALSTGLASLAPTLAARPGRHRSPPPPPCGRAGCGLAA